MSKFFKPSWIIKFFYLLNNYLQQKFTRSKFLSHQELSKVFFSSIIIIFNKSLPDQSKHWKWPRTKPCRTTRSWRTACAWRRAASKLSSCSRAPFETPRKTGSPCSAEVWKKRRMNLSHVRIEETRGLVVKADGSRSRGRGFVSRPRDHLISTDHLDQQSMFTTWTEMWPGTVACAVQMGGWILKNGRLIKANQLTENNVTQNSFIRLDF